ncbi:MAG: type I DNA topoisomerase [Clostridia bacterium]|nr:type I DNA topoisomerase [Clostridia bacterium]
MATLVIVESPSKAKTIQKYLGNGYEVMASKGHVRDLPKTLLGVDVDNGFKPRYVDIAGKSALIRELREHAERADRVLLAADPDREGEAISWHLASLLGVDLKDKNRVTFNEITQSGIKQGMAHPRAIDMDLVNAQQARRVLDRIVGYKISPFLWRKIRKGLSAGRVQSATVKLVIDREEEIRAFKSEEYWTLDANLMPQGSRKAFPAKFYGDKKQKIKISDEKTATALATELNSASYKIGAVKYSKRQVTPAPPFVTSTLQQEANRKLGFETRRTMKTAQELYEGVTLPDIGAVGLITYMRTDSLRISEDARKEGNAYIEKTYGKEYLPEKPRYYKSRKGAQDAHEAIRPSTPSITPASVKEALTPDQYKLYKLIWERFIASLMAVCVQKTCQADIEAGDYVFKASGYTVAFDGYTVLYVEGKDEEDEENASLPELTEGMELKLKALTPNQHFTQPPARFTEASLVKAMEENGIGRPSTYAPTIGTILSREYIERAGKAFKPTALGEVTTKWMEEQFPEIVDVKFTAQMEKRLDAVENGENDWVETLGEFYGDFKNRLDAAEDTLSGERIKVPEVETNEVCELCGRKMVIKAGRFGKFLACPGYPDCKNTKRLVEKTAGVCPKCGGAILAKKSRNGRRFFGCGNYPKCDFVSWNEPSGETCPNCGKTLFVKKGKTEKLFCQTEGCGFTKTATKTEEA